MCLISPLRMDKHCLILVLVSVIDWIMVPNSAHVQSLAPVKVALYGKIDFANSIKLRILSWGDYPGSPQQAWCDHKCLVGGTQRSQPQPRDVMMEAGGGHLNVCCCWLWGCRCLWNLERARRWILSWSFQKEHHPADPYETSGLQNSKRISLC